MSSSSLASALAGAAILLLPTSPSTIYLWDNLFKKAIVMLDYLRAGLLASPCPEGAGVTMAITPPRKYIGTASFEGEAFQRLYCGLSGAAQLVTRLNSRCEAGTTGASGLVSAKSSHFVSALMTLRQNALTLLGALRRSEQSIHPLLVGQVQLIARADTSQLTLPPSSSSEEETASLGDSSQRGSRVASSYGNKRGVVL